MCRQAMVGYIEQHISWQMQIIFLRERCNDSMRSCLRKCETVFP